VAEATWSTKVTLQPVSKLMIPLVHSVTHAMNKENAEHSKKSPRALTLATVTAKQKKSSVRYTGL